MNMRSLRGGYTAWSPFFWSRLYRITQPIITLGGRPWCRLPWPLRRLMIANCRFTSNRMRVYVAKTTPR